MNYLSIVLAADGSMSIIFGGLSAVLAYFILRGILKLFGKEVGVDTEIPELNKEDAVKINQQFNKWKEENPEEYEETMKDYYGEKKWKKIKAKRKMEED